MSMIKDLTEYIRLYQVRNVKTGLYLGEEMYKGKVCGKPRVFNMKNHATQAIWGNKADWEVIENIYNLVDTFVV